MNAANLSETVADAAGAQGALPEPPREPSMEDILASIRRIIAQDQSLFAAEAQGNAAVDPGPTVAPDEVEQVGALAADGGLRGALPPQAISQEAASDGDRCDQSDEPRDWADAPAEPLVSPATDASVEAAFKALVASRFAQNSDAMLAVTREALRPLLQAWLDAHLPALVERLVRAEIERIAARV